MSINESTARAAKMLEEMRAANAQYEAGLDDIESKADQVSERVDAVIPVLKKAEEEADDQMTKLAIEEAQELAN